jgi:hypothetical protein
MCSLNDQLIVTSGGGIYKMDRSENNILWKWSNKKAAKRMQMIMKKTKE